MTKQFPASLSDILALPRHLQATMNADAIDNNGHVHIWRYGELHREGLANLFAGVGIDERYNVSRRMGIFTLEQHVVYHAESFAGDEVGVHCRLARRSDRLVHAASFVVNLSRAKVVNTFEVMIGHVSLERRRITPFPQDVAARLDKEIAATPLRWISASRELRL